MPPSDDGEPPPAEARRPRPSLRDPIAPPPEEPGPYQRRSWIIGGLLAAVFLVFGGVVWLAWRDGAGGADGEVPLIRADARPFKVSPDDPGGLEVPNQRLSVNVLLDSEPTAEASEPAQPMPAEPEVAEIPPPPTPRGGEEEAQPAPSPPPASEQPQVAAVETGPAGPEVTVVQTGPTEPQVTVVRPAAEPQPAANVTVTRTEPAPEPPAVPPTVEAAPAAAPGAQRVYRIQLAAVRDEARARQAATELWGTYGDVLGGVEPRVERAEIGDAVFFRIQAGPFDERAVADEICAQLKARQAACIVVSG